MASIHPLDEGVPIEKSLDVKECTLENALIQDARAQGYDVDANNERLYEYFIGNLPRYREKHPGTYVMIDFYRREYFYLTSSEWELEKVKNEYRKGSRPFFAQIPPNKEKAIDIPVALSLVQIALG